MRKAQNLSDGVMEIQDLMKYVKLFSRKGKNKSLIIYSLHEQDSFTVLHLRAQTMHNAFSANTI